MTVAQTLPASRDTVENKAVAKARPSPTSASRNLTQTSAEADWSHWARRLGTDWLDFNGLAYAEPTSSEPSIVGRNGQSRSGCGESVRNLREQGSIWHSRAKRHSGNTEGATSSDSDFVVLPFWTRRNSAPQLAAKIPSRIFKESSMPIGKRVAAEFIGTFWLVFGGCGAAVLAAGFPSVGI